MSLPPGTPPPPGSFDSGTGRIYGSIVPVTITCTVAVVLRFVSRRLAHAKFWWDDALIVAALIFYYALTVLAILQTAKWGLGRHIWILDPQTQIEPLLKALIAYQVLYYLCQVSVKLSLIGLYFRVFKPSHMFRVACYAMSAITLAWFVAFFVATLCACIPLSEFWNPEQLVGRKCINEVDFFYSVGITNLLLDVMILCLPIPMILRLKITLRVKLTLLVIFALGFFVCAVDSIRITCIHALSTGSDVTWIAIDVYVWTEVETAMSVLCACLPTMRPLVSTFLHHTTASGSATAKDSSSKRSESWKWGNTSSNGTATTVFSRMDGPDLEEDERPIILASMAHADAPRGVVTRIEHGNTYDVERAEARRDLQLSHPLGAEDTAIYVRNTIQQD